MRPSCFLVLGTMGLLTWVSEAVKLCSGPNGSLDLLPGSSYVATIPENGINTVFVKYQGMYNLTCSSNEQVPVQIKYQHYQGSTKLKSSLEDSPESQNGTIQHQLNSTKMRNKSFTNTWNLTVSCMAQGEPVCDINLILIKQPKKPDCVDLDNNLSCNVTDFNVSSAGKTSLHGRTNTGGQQFPPVIKYAFYNEDEWVYCSEVDINGTVILDASSTNESKTKTIKCPIEKTEVQQAVVIRVETVKKSYAAAALSILMKSSDKPDFTYFTVFVDAYVPHPMPDEGISDLVLGIIFAVLIVLIVILAFVIFCCFRQKLTDFKKQANQHHTELAEVASVATESTTLSARSRKDYMSDLWSLLNLEDEPTFREMKGDKFKQLVQRQLSGDPSKLNPKVTLNQQINILSYDPKLEIDRSMFTLGEILGSGNFGSVYGGEAEGLLHPGSMTKVAIKTVNDVLDLGQFTALMCEMKILTNLDLHLNLVNLLGSCTSQLENRSLWLLLEFCPGGDLKSYLIQHRQEFKNGISGQVATDHEPRIFLKWAHSIAKGMEYLTSKKIMHGDLAARNILIGENRVAKVSDFGLSKSMYDNIRYKKQRRNYVPWKWMALEYLNDAVFTLKSDVWSYGVVLWEMFSLGQEPYGSQAPEDSVAAIKSGVRLTLPPEVAGKGLDWPELIFSDVMLPSWTGAPEDRISFSEIVDILQGLMDTEELMEYNQLTEEYKAMQELLLNEEFASKRSTMPTPNPSSADLGKGYQRMFSFSHDMQPSGNSLGPPSPNSMATPPVYTSFVSKDGPCNAQISAPPPASNANGYTAFKPNSITPTAFKPSSNGNSNGYASLQQINSESGKIPASQTNPSPYLSLEQAKAVKQSPGSPHKGYVQLGTVNGTQDRDDLSVSVASASKSQCKGLSSGYVALEALKT